MSNEEFWQKLDEEREMYARKFHMVRGIIIVIALIASIGFIATLNVGITPAIIFAVVDSICIGYICYASATHELGFEDFGNILFFMFISFGILWFLIKIIRIF